MLETLKVTNFKAWRELDISLGKVTGLFGTNSSGKSSVLQFLLMLKQTKNATDHGLVLDFGGPGRTRRPREFSRCSSRSRGRNADGVDT